jgi:hypothetical protein
MVMQDLIAQHSLPQKHITLYVPVIRVMLIVLVFQQIENTTMGTHRETSKMLCDCMHSANTHFWFD